MSTETICRACGQTHVGRSRLCQWCSQVLVGPTGMKAAGLGRRFAALLLDSVLWIPTLIIGYIVWVLVVYARGQTPGKQIMGIRVVRVDGTEAGWGLTFVREFLIKGIVFGFISGFTSGIFGLVNYLWPFADRDQQAIHDKLMSTLVVQGTKLAM